MQSNSSHKRKLTHKFTQLKVSGDFPAYPGVFSFELMGATLETWHKSTELRPLATKPRHFPHYQMAVLTSVRTSKFLTSHDGSPSREKHKFRYICRPSAAGDGRSIPAFFFCFSLMGVKRDPSWQKPPNGLFSPALVSRQLGTQAFENGTGRFNRLAHTSPKTTEKSPCFPLSNKFSSFFSDTPKKVEKHLQMGDLQRK